MQTIKDVPGVEPSTLIELMSGKIIQLQADNSKTKTTLQQAQSQINSLQRVAASTVTGVANQHAAGRGGSSSSSSREGLPNASTSSAAGIRRSRSASPAPVRDRSPSGIGEIICCCCC